MNELINKLSDIREKLLENCNNKDLLGIKFQINKLDNIIYDLQKDNHKKIEQDGNYRERDFDAHED